MTPEQAELAKRLVQHPRWEWRDGMLAVDGCHAWRVVQSRDTGVGCLWECEVPEYAWPDLADWATVGVLLGMLDGATGEHLNISLTQDTGYIGWEVEVEDLAGERWHYASGDTPGEATAKALLEVWEDEHGCAQMRADARTTSTGGGDG